MNCPNDTNGDGGCGIPTCAVCHPEYQAMVRLPVSLFSTDTGSTLEMTRAVSEKLTAMVNANKGCPLVSFSLKRVERERRYEIHDMGLIWPPAVGVPANLVKLADDAVATRDASGAWVVSHEGDPLFSLPSSLTAAQVEAVVPTMESYRSGGFKRGEEHGREQERVKIRDVCGLILGQPSHVEPRTWEGGKIERRR